MSKIPSWNDSMIDGARDVVAYLEKLLSERSQLYGMLIHIMLLTGKTEYNVPDPSWFKELGGKYYVAFYPEEGTGKWIAKLQERKVQDGN